MIMAVVLMAVSACEQERNAERTKSGLQLADFEAMHQGDSIGLYVLTNRQGGEVCITNYGGRILSLHGLKCFSVPIPYFLFNCLTCLIGL